MTETILVVDDDVDSLKLVRLMLERQGYNVIIADAGNKALAVAEQNQPDLIILDVMMPDMDGLEVCRRLRANVTTSTTPVIMFTAKTMIEDKVKGFEAGVDDYLTKPTHPTELASRVKSMLERKQARSESSLPSSKEVGRIIGVMGVKGGIGTTTLALNIAAALLQKGEEPILIDLCLGDGSMGAMLGTKSSGLFDALNHESLDPEILENEMIIHQSGLKALLSSPDPGEAKFPFESSHAISLLQCARELGDPIIVDLGHRLTGLNAELLPELDQILYTVEASSVALELAASHLAELDMLVDPGQINLIIINRSVVAMPWHKVEDILRREVMMNISAAPELAFEAAEDRKIILHLKPSAMVSGQYQKLAERLQA